MYNSRSGAFAKLSFGYSGKQSSLENECGSQNLPTDSLTIHVKGKKMERNQKPTRRFVCSSSSSSSCPSGSHRHPALPAAAAAEEWR
jgi:hypothetical protein